MNMEAFANITQFTLSLTDFPGKKEVRSAGHQQRSLLHSSYSPTRTPSLANRCSYFNISSISESKIASQQAFTAAFC